MSKRAWLLGSRGLAGVGVAVLTLAGCATNPVTGEKDFVLMSAAQERELGARYHEQMLEQQDVYDDPEVQAYVERLGAALAAKSHRPELDYEFTVLDDPTVNAFALPGGYIYVTRGILAYFRSDAELAGVLGHEIGHVTARHSVQRYSAQKATSVLGSVLLAEAGAGRAGAELFRTVQLAAIRGYGREQELQADRLGAQYLARIGYDPQAMRAVIGVLADQEAYAADHTEGDGGASYHGLFATHPENDERFQRVVRAARQYRAETQRHPDPVEYHRLLDGMTFGPGAGDGLVVDNRFLHLALDAALTAPEGWTIENRPDRLIVAPSDGDAQMQVTAEAVEADARAAEILREHAGEGALERGRTLERAAHPAYTGLTTLETRGGSRRVRQTVVINNGYAWHFAGAGRTSGAFEHFDEHFLDTAASLRGLKPAERERAHPLEIRIVEADRFASYEALAKGVPERVAHPVDRLRLLNGDYPEGRLRSSGPVKTLR